MRCNNQLSLVQYCIWKKLYLYFKSKAIKYDTYYIFDNWVFKLNFSVHWIECFQWILDKILIFEKINEISNELITFWTVNRYWIYKFLNFFQSVEHIYNKMIIYLFKRRHSYRHITEQEIAGYCIASLNYWIEWCNN